MKAIVLVDQNWGIASGGKIIGKISEDMSRFKQKTTGEVVVMGRKTFESMNGIPLPDRINIIVSKSMYYNTYLKTVDGFIYDIGQLSDGVFVVPDINAIQHIHGFLGVSEDSVYIIGGEEIYKQLIPICTEVLVTQFNNYTKDRPDKFFENLLMSPTWKCSNSGRLTISKSLIMFKYDTYIKRNISDFNEISTTSPYPYSSATKNRPTPLTGREELIRYINYNISLVSDKEREEWNDTIRIEIHSIYDDDELNDIAAMFQREGYAFSYEKFQSHMDIIIKW